MPIIPTSFNNIKVGYISQTEGYIKNVSLTDANTYAQSFPDTQFIFIDGDALLACLLPLRWQVMVICCVV